MIDPTAIEPQPGLYLHHKGGTYQLYGLVVHSETREPMVRYRRLRPDPETVDQVRPLAMWSERVDRDHWHGPRFVYIGPAPEEPADADAALGRLVRALPVGRSLHHADAEMWAVTDFADHGRWVAHAATPEEALERAAAPRAERED